MDAISREREPAYLQLHRSGELEARARRARGRLASCDLCAHACGVDRRESAEGTVCRTQGRAVVSSYGAHHGEEDPLRGTAGSGTIFFAWCNLRCVFCQNADISQSGDGVEVDDAELAAMMLDLARQGCHNINLVSPSHVVAPILGALCHAASRGLRLPVVYNTGGFDSPVSLALLDGVVDLYMPDMKYGDAGIGQRYSMARDYPQVNREAVREMHRQVGDLEIGADGVARRGLLVRHLVLPNSLAGTERILAFLAEEISKNTYVNIMGQYRPCHRAHEDPALARRPSASEMAEAFAIARRLGLERLDRR